MSVIHLFRKPFQPTRLQVLDLSGPIPPVSYQDCDWCGESTPDDKAKLAYRLWPGGAREDLYLCFPCNELWHSMPYRARHPRAAWKYARVEVW